MAEIEEGKLIFHFPEDWQVCQYDKTTYHKKFQTIQDGIKALDMIAIEPQGTCWLIEVKDYRRSRRTKPIDLADEIAQKVIFSLASLLPAKLNSDDMEEGRFAAAVLKTKKLRVALHLEQPRKPSKLFPQTIDPADVLQKLKRRIKPVDPHPKIFSGEKGCGWKVRILNPLSGKIK